MKEMARKLVDFVNSEKLYLEPSIQKQKRTLNRRFNMSGSELEELVKTTWDVGFSEWITRKRLDEARSMLVSPDHAGAKIISIAFLCGFSEINPFNRLFKEETGMTPTEYRAFHLHFKRVVGVSPGEYERDKKS